MLTGTIQNITDHGSIVEILIHDIAGSEHPAFWDVGPMSYFLEDVIATAAAEGVPPNELLVRASGPGLAEWLSIVPALEV